MKSPFGSGQLLHLKTLDGVLVSSHRIAFRDDGLAIVQVPGKDEWILFVEATVTEPANREAPKCAICDKPPDLSRDEIWVNCRWNGGVVVNPGEDRCQMHKVCFDGPEFAGCRECYSVCGHSAVCPKG